MSGGDEGPDVVGAAREEGKQERLTAAQATMADRPDQYDPFGSLTWQKGGPIVGGSIAEGRTVGGRRGMYTSNDPNKWTQQYTLNAPMQRNLNSAMGVTNSMSGLREDAMARAEQEMSGDLDWGQFGQAEGLEFDPTELRQRAEDAAYGRQTSRLDPQFEQRARETEVKLRNRGLRPGDEAYDNAMGNFNRGRNDAYEQARMGSVGMGMQEANQMFGQEVKSTDMANALRDKNIQEYIDKRNFSLNEAQSLDPTAQVKQLRDTYSGGE